ncbi:MAG: hypothetical protein E6I44_09190 [Chloroflexi bacterium]|nr:MAG: hypothetical protein E6I44_09190 [Chloroflexota bacterium]
MRAFSRWMTLTLLFVAFVTSACRSMPDETVASPVTSPPSTSPAATEPSSTHAVTTEPSPPVTTTLPSPLTAAPAPITRVATAALGDLRGGRVYALKQFATPSGTGVIRELWSSTLEGASITTLAARIEFPSEVSVVVGKPGIALRHIFSPDGRRVVVTDGDYRLTIIDLVSGRASSLGIEGYAPTWTRDGRWIVYAVFDPSADSVNPYRLWAIPADLTDRPRQIPGDSVAALADRSRIVVYDSRAGGQTIVDVTDGKQLGRLPDLVDGITWRSAPPEYAFVRNQQLTPGGGRPDDTTTIIVASDDLGSPRIVVQRTGSQYEVRFRDLRWNPLRDELLYSVEGVDRAYGIVQISSGAERSLPATAQYLTWAQDGEHLVGLARGDGGPRPSGLPVSIDFKRATVVVLARDGTITRSTAISALEPFEVLSQVATVGY